MNELDLQGAILRAGPRLVLGMLYKLSVHANKGPWDQKPLEDLVAGLESEMAELKEALRKAEPYPRILDECADIANYCLMIADHVARVGNEWTEEDEKAMANQPQAYGDRKRCGYISDHGWRCILFLNHKDGHDFGSH